MIKPVKAWPRPITVIVAEPPKRTEEQGGDKAASGAQMAQMNGPIPIEDLRETVCVLQAAGARVATKFLTAYDSVPRPDIAELGKDFYASAVMAIARERGTEGVLKRTIAALCTGKTPTKEVEHG